VTVPLTAEERARIDEIHEHKVFLNILHGYQPDFGGRQFHVHHTVAITWNGKEHPDNLKIMNGPENCRIGNRT